MSKKVDWLKHTVHCCTIQLKLKSPEMWNWVDRNCCNSITLNSSLQWVSAINKYQFSVLQTTCDSLTDAVSDWLSVIRVCRRFVMTSCLFAAAAAYSWSLCGWRCSHCKYLFISEPNDANVTERIFLATLHGSSFNSIPQQGDFCTKTFHMDVYYNYQFTTNLLLSLAVKEFWKSVNIWQR